MRLACPVQAGGSHYFQYPEHFCVRDYRVLNDLSKTLIEFAARQRSQNIEIVNHQRRLMKSAD